MSFDKAAFRELYAKFDEACVSDRLLDLMAEQATCLVSAQGCTCNEFAMYALVAHLLEKACAADKGNGSTGGPLQSATIDRVAVSFATAQPRTAWEAWLVSTTYGQQAFAMMYACSAGGYFIGGNPERDAFTGAYGIRGG